jgi:hypothetical protein
MRPSTVLVPARLDSTGHLGVLTGETSISVPSLRGTCDRSELPTGGTLARFDLRHELEVDTPVPVPSSLGMFKADSKPIQLWEGVVTAVGAASMDVRLNAKHGKLPQHTASIALEWVHEQDLSLVKPGAVFYLTLFRKLNRGSIQNSQEIRFRRLPSWSDLDVGRLRSAAEALKRKAVLPHVSS